MRYKNVLITGGSGKLGRALLASGLSGRNILVPTRGEMDITDKLSVKEYFDKHKIDAVIHCAALTSMKVCEDDPAEAIDVNITGTSNIIENALKKIDTRIIYISTDYVYPCVKGPYKEEDKTGPFTVYGWTKFGGECVAKIVFNHCIIRTSFFEPNNIPFDSAPTDAFCSKIPISELVGAIIELIDSDFIGTVNVGREKVSLYEAFKGYKKDIKAVTLEEINRIAPIKRARDSSLDVSLWKRLMANN